MKNDDEERGESETATPEELAAACGFELHPAEKFSSATGLRKPLPGYLGVLEQVAATLASDAAVAGTSPMSDAEIQALCAKIATLMNAEAALEEAYRAAYEQRMLLDDKGMAVLRRVKKAVALLGDTPTKERWAFLNDYLDTFAGGGVKGTKKPAGEKGS